MERPEEPEPNRFRTLPGPVPAEAYVETVDVSEHHELDTESEERARFLRTAGA